MNSRGFALIPLLIILLLAGAAGFGLTKKVCKEISPLKPGQDDSRAVMKNGKLYWCDQTYFEKLSGPLFRKSIPRASTSPEPYGISNWKTFNSEYGFSVRYPWDWEAVKDLGWKIRTKHFTTRKAQGYEIQDPGDENKTVREYDGEISITTTDIGPLSAIKNDTDCRQGAFVTLGGNSFLKCTYGLEGFTYFSYYITSPNKNMGILVFGAKSNERMLSAEKLNSVAIQILTTLKFK